MLDARPDLVEALSGAMRALISPAVLLSPAVAWVVIDDFRSYSIMFSSDNAEVAPSLMVSNDLPGPCAKLELGEIERALDSSLRAASRLAAICPSKLSLMPGKWFSPDSFRGIGVADGSIETTERIGNTLSTEPGDMVVASFDGDSGGSWAPEKILKLVWRGDIPILVLVEALRDPDRDAELPWSDLVEACEFVEVLRDGGPSHWVGFSAGIFMFVDL